MVQIGGNVAKNKATARKPKERSKKVVRSLAETEAVDRAFDEIILEHGVTTGLEQLAESGGLPNVDPDA